MADFIAGALTSEAVAGEGLVCPESKRLEKINRKKLSLKICIAESILIINNKVTVLSVKILFAFFFCF